MFTGYKAIANIFKFQAQFGYFEHKDIFRLFDSIVQPILCYSSEIWGYRYCETIERIHFKFCKRVACLNSNVSNMMALSECGRHTLNVIYMTRCVKYWVKLTRLEENRYPKQCYVTLRTLDDFGKTTWASGVRNLLFEHGFGYAWIADGVGNVNSFLAVFKSRLKDCAIQTIQGFINSSSKAQYYKYYTTLLNPERYLSVDLPYILKKSFASFRCSSHDLLIEKGRHMNIDRDFRFCPFCLKQNIYVVEDKFHFLLICPL